MRCCSASACAACARSCSPSVARPASASATSRKAVWIAFSYCATAMSRLRLRRAPGWPGCGRRRRSAAAAAARSSRPQVPLLNRPDSSAAGRAGAGGQRDAREEGRARGADVGVGRDQLLLGRADVGPAHQHVGRQARPAGRADRLLRVERQRRRQVGRQRLADQQHQRVLVERALALRLRERCTRAVSSSDSAWRRSSSDAAPLSKRSLVSR